jgi:monoamine oxidase
MNDVDVVVIGAGAAGIAAARRIDEAGRSAVVLEARSRVGGRGWTLRDHSGLALDLGCGWLHSAPTNEWTGLARTLGFAIDEALPAWSRPALGLAADAQHDFGATLQRLFDRIEEVGESGPDRPAADLIEPDSKWRTLIDAVSTWINGVELDRVSVHDFFRYRDSGVNWRVTAGYGALFEAAASDLDIVRDTPATRIDHSGTMLRVETGRGDIRARIVIVTVPTGVIADEALGFFPALPDKVAAAQALPLGLADKLFLRVEDAGDLPVERRLFGAIDAPTASYHLRPLGSPLIEAYFGGALARELEAGGEDAFFAFAADQLAAQLGADIRKRLSLVVASAWARDPFARGSYSYARVGHCDQRAVLAAPVDGRLLFAGEACSRHDFSTAHGGYRTGIAAAEQAVAALAGEQAG